MGPTAAEAAQVRATTMAMTTAMAIRTVRSSLVRNDRAQTKRPQAGAQAAQTATVCSLTTTDQATWAQGWDTFSLCSFQKTWGCKL